MSADETSGKAAVAGLFDDLAATYDTVVDHFDRFGQRLVDVAGLRPGDRVLDLACGTGAVLRPARAAVGDDGSVLGIDLAPAMVARLRRELASAGTTNVDVTVGDAEQLDAPDGSFDAVTGGFMIFFPPDPPRVLAEARRVLRPGGRLALSIYDGPAGFPFQVELEASIGAVRPQAGPGGPFNSAAVLTDALAAAGFAGIETIDITERFRFRSSEHVEQWQRSTGYRRLLDSLDEERLAAYRAGFAERLRAFRADGGGFALDQRAVAVLAIT